MIAPAHATIRRTVAHPDRHLTRAASVIARCAPDGPVSLGALVGRNKSQPSRWLNAEAHNPVSRAIEFTENMCRGETTTPFPLLVELRIVTLREALSGREDGWLIRKWHTLRDRECLAEAAEKRASRLRALSRDAYRVALKVEAEIQCELVAIDEELEARKIEPERYSSAGMLLIRDDS